MRELLEKWLLTPTAGKLLLGALVIVAAVFLARLLRRLMIHYVPENERRYRLRKFINFLALLLAIFLLSIVFSDKLSSLTVAFGVAGAGIAFALQEVIMSVAGWAAMSFGRFYSVGDRVELGGIRGDVVDIGVLRTTLMEMGEWINGDQYNGRIVRIANSFIFKAPVFNYSADFPFLWDELVIPVRYGSDHKRAREMFLDALTRVTGDYAEQSKAIWSQMTRRYLIEAANVEPSVTMKLTDNWIEFTLRYIVDHKKRRSTKDKICELILEGVDASNGGVQLGSATFEITALPAVAVKVSTPDKA